MQYLKGLCYQQLERYKKSIAVMKNALEQWESVPGEDQWCIFETKYKIANISYISCQYRQALRWIRKVLMGDESLSKISSEQKLKLQYLRGLSYQQLRRYKKSIAVMKNALKQWESVLREDHWCILDLKHEIACTFWDSYQDREALEWALVSLAGDVKAFGPDHLEYHRVIETEDHVANIYPVLRLYDEELNWLETTYARRTEVHGVEDWRTLQIKDRMDVFRYRLSADYRNMEESSLNISRAPSIVSLQSPMDSEEGVEDFEHDEMVHSEESDDENSIYSLEYPSNAFSRSLASSQEIIYDSENDERGFDGESEEGSSLYSLETSSTTSLQRPDSSDEFFNNFEYPEIF